jgi:hypothetical protein
VARSSSSSRTLCVDPGRSVQERSQCCPGHHLVKCQVTFPTITSRKETHKLPASRSSTVAMTTSDQRLAKSPPDWCDQLFTSSDKRVATTVPAMPAPTTIKSYDESNQSSTRSGTMSRPWQMTVKRKSSHLSHGVALRAIPPQSVLQRRLLRQFPPLVTCM